MASKANEEKPLKVIVNLGNPRKAIGNIADTIFGTCARKELKLTGVEIYRTDDLLLTSAAYGAGMTLDVLSELKVDGLLDRGAEVIFVGSMGSLNEDEITLGNVVVPNPSGCAYYGFEELWLRQDEHLLALVEKALAERGIACREYKHGSSFAVFDPHTDHTTYTTNLYGTDVVGVDCGEVFIGLHFAKVNKMRAAAVLYCSDSPNTHIAEIGAAEFNKRAVETDVLLNEIAASVLRRGF